MKNVFVLRLIIRLFDSCKTEEKVLETTSGAISKKKIKRPSSSTNHTHPDT